MTTGTCAVTVATTSTGEALATSIDKAVSFSGNNKHLAQNSNGQSTNPIRMGDKGALILTAPSSGETSGAGDSGPHGLLQLYLNQIEIHPISISGIKEKAQEVQMIIFI